MEVKKPSSFRRIICHGLYCILWLILSELYLVHIIGHHKTYLIIQTIFPSLAASVIPVNLSYFIMSSWTYCGHLMISFGPIYVTAVVKGPNVRSGYDICEPEPDSPDNNIIWLPGKNRILLKPTALCTPNTGTARSSKLLLIWSDQTLSIPPECTGGIANILNMCLTIKIMSIDFKCVANQEMLDHYL